jgi:hypothetical protein
MKETLNHTHTHTHYHQILQMMISYWSSASLRAAACAWQPPHVFAVGVGATCVALLHFLALPWTMDKIVSLLLQADVCGCGSCSFAWAVLCSEQMLLV